MWTTKVVYATPRKLPKASTLHGRVVVLDIAFASNAGGASFEKVTLPFIRGLGDRLVMWVDHHDHDRHRDYRHDPRFVLATKQEHPACPEMITEELVQRAFPVQTICCHIDFDGLCAAAKWIREGRQPYEQADDDARCIDTRMGQPSARGVTLDRALRARPRDESLRNVIVEYLVLGAEDSNRFDFIQRAADEMTAIERATEQIASGYRVVGNVAIVSARGRSSYDKTQLLLLGQQLATVSVVHDEHTVTAAARFDSGVDLVKLLGLHGGMPTRVSVAERMLPTLLVSLGLEVDEVERIVRQSGA